MRVSTCCCGCSLEMGCKIIAILGLIGGVLGFFWTELMMNCENACVAYMGESVLKIIASGSLLRGAL